MKNHSVTSVSNAVDKAHHTPGRWTAVPDDGTGTLPCVLSDKITQYGNFYVAVVQSTNFSDACLIAAAPDLLVACQAALLHAQLIGSGQESPYSNAEICELTGTAIAKATQ